MTDEFNGFKCRKRSSQLGISRFCGKAAQLGEGRGAGRAAAMSTAFHALMADSPHASDLIALLTKDEQEKLRSWKKPEPLVLVESDDAAVRVELDYRKALRELLVGLDENGDYADPTKQDVLVRGHVDCAWIVDLPTMRVAYVTDWKKSEFTCTEGPDDPQILSYSMAVADRYLCHAYVPAIYSLEEGQWSFGELTELGSTRHAAHWQLVRAAAQNDGEFATGPHCLSCWSREHCPEFLLPAAAFNGTELEPFTKPGALTPDVAISALMKAKALQKVCESVIENVKAYATHNRVYDSTTNKVYKPVMVSGRTTLDRAALEYHMGDKLRNYEKKGAPFVQMKWVKP
jgi:hypothetical protein